VTFRRPSPPLATLRLLRVSSEYASAARLARNDDGSPKPDTYSRTGPYFPGSVEIVAVAAGFAHSLALDANGNVWAWGRNQAGQLGDGTTVDRHIPTAIGLANVVAIDAGDHHSLALLANGMLMGWGHNARGQLGDGTLTPQYTFRMMWRRASVRCPLKRPAPRTSAGPVTIVQRALRHYCTISSPAFENAKRLFVGSRTAH
ncbi:MAG: hypothetical protein GY711_09185, partial [bacterium]|nr:hypothetical protein [bacterium]